MIIFFYGEDAFRINEKLSELKNKYFEKNSSGSDLSVLDYEENISAQTLEEKMLSQGLFSAKRFVVVKNAMTMIAEKQKGILEIIKKTPEDPDLILVFAEYASPKKNGSLFKFLVAHAKKQELNPLSGEKLKSWIIQQTKKLSPDVSFSNQALEALLAFCGNDLFVLSNEILKLVNYKNSGEISRNDVNLLVKSKIDSTMFQTIEAMADANKKKSFELLHQQLEKGEDPYYILSMYAYQIRVLLKIASAYEGGNTNYFSIAKEVGLHPYVVQKSYNQAIKMGAGKIKQLFNQIVSIDQKVKTGKIDPVLALDQFIISL